MISFYFYPPPFNPCSMIIITNVKPYYQIIQKRAYTWVPIFRLRFLQSHQPSFQGIIIISTPEDLRRREHRYLDIFHRGCGWYQSYQQHQHALQSCIIWFDLVHRGGWGDGVCYVQLWCPLLFRKSSAQVIEVGCLTTTIRHHHKNIEISAGPQTCCQQEIPQPKNIRKAHAHSFEYPPIKWLSLWVLICP